jgi:hypothetical protein
VKRETACTVYTAGGGKGNTLHVHAVGGGKGNTLRVHRRPLMRRETRRRGEKFINVLTFVEI